jgi:hypothetical protein
MHDLATAVTKVYGGGAELSCRQPLALTNASLRHAGVCQGRHPIGYRLG